MEPVLIEMERARQIELKNCPICKSTLKKVKIERKGIILTGYKCSRCNEVFFPSDEVFKYEILSGKRKMTRKIGKVGHSIVIRIPNKIAQELGIEKGDVAFFEKKGNEIKIRIISE